MLIKLGVFIGQNFWLVIMLLSLFVEAMTVALVSVWFALGALLAWIAEILGASLTTQVLLFFSSSLLTLAFTFKFQPLRRHLCRQVVPTNCDALIGQVGVVIKEVTNDMSQAAGQIRVNQQIWSAYISPDETEATSYIVGSKVKVIKIVGVHAYVTATE
ncbi:NfeD family protein [Amygdalobacter nucleatus]|uniref:Nodulation efficiency protein D n=1 Tax=Amygdalobacter nucleatus TaxID=3029274 RepID=A0A133YHC3_9FIRM|nr:NfeD family protein [Amygdalobacter nucleatus]KXB42589.1 nodulation efficiency protein D [Amygdalobacter nucleatus]MDF0486160.1 NfeD family protein [Amygdalobacter nucleatus]